MGIIKNGTLFLAFVFLFNIYQSTAQGIPYQKETSKPTPVRSERPRYMIENNAVHLLGNNPGIPVVVGDLFLGVFEGDRFRPVNPHNRLALVNIREIRNVYVTEEERNRLLNIYHTIRGNQRRGNCSQ